jgi:hypothetical protein
VVRADLDRVLQSSVCRACCRDREVEWRLHGDKGFWKAEGGDW